MKHIILAAFLLILSVSGLFAIRPKIDYQADYLEVTDVERHDTCLRVSVILKHLPGYWINISKKGTFLRSRNDTARTYRLIGSENFELNKRIWMKESGQHKGVLIFEKLPADVRVVDMMETEDSGNIECIVAGINLEEEDTNQQPSMIDPGTLLGSASSERWDGLDPARYGDIPYYQEKGKAHVKGRIHGYHPVAGFSNLKIYTNNYITGSTDRQTESLNTDGSFEFDLNVDYPQYSTFVFGDLTTKDVFVIPGDTVEIVTTMETDFLKPTAGYRKYFGYNGKVNDAAAVNLLTDSLISRLHLDEIIFKCYADKTDTLAISDNHKKEEIETAVNNVITELHDFLSPIPVSTYVKDLLATEAVSRLAIACEPSDGIKRLISCNPLTISTGYGFKYNPISIVSFNDSISTSQAENSFLHQLRAVNSLLEAIEVRTIHNRESLDKTKQNVAVLATQITYPALNQALLDAYGELTEDVVLEEHALKKDSEFTRLDIDDDADILQELIKPYEGNLIYVDFWALWCASCRHGIIGQKKVIEHFAGRPFKVLYVSDDTNIAGSNQWLEKKEIPGEHIYISSENWKRVFKYFNIDYIPFGVLIGKEGNLIKTHFFLDHHNSEKEIERHLND